MKNKLLAAFGLVLSVGCSYLAGALIPNGALIALILFGGIDALFGLGGILLTFIVGFMVQSGLNPMELWLGL